MPRKLRRDTEENPLEKGEYAEDLKQLAVRCIRTYFKDKPYFTGGSIPEGEMMSEKALKTVLRTAFDDRCFDFLHACCLPTIQKDPEYKDITVSWTVHSLLGLLRDLRDKGIPKDFQPGILLLYFKFCKGVPILSPPLL